jgi:chromosome segregation ATPase
VRRVLPALVALGLLLRAAGPVAAQGLGDAATKERQKRQAKPPAEKSRVLTNEDLPRSGGGETSAPAAAAEPAPDQTGSYQAQRERTSDGEDESKQARIDAAKTRADDARAEVASAEQRLKDLRDKLNPMSTSFIYGQANNVDQANEELRTRAEITEAEAQLAAAREALVKANQDYDDALQGRPAPPPE